MNAAASAGSSCAISSSIFAQIGTARVFAPLHEILQPGELHGAIRLRQILLVEIEHEQQRLRREELKAAQPPRVVRRQSSSRSGLPVFEQRAAALQDLLLLLQLRGGAGFLQIALEPLEPPLDDAEVREDDLVLHRPHVARRIDRAGRVRHRRDRGTCARRGAARRRCGTARRRAARPRRFFLPRRRPCRRIRPSPACASSG